MIENTAALSGTQNSQTPRPTLYAVQSPPARQRQVSVKAAFTVPCAKGCGRPVPAQEDGDRLVAKSKTGQCRYCWQSGPGPSANARSRNGGGEARKREPREQLAMAARMLRSAARRATDEDPGEGLAFLLNLADELPDLINRCGVKLRAEIGSPTAMADDLENETGKPWSRQRVEDRWGPGSKNAARFTAGEGS